MPLRTVTVLALALCTRSAVAQTWIAPEEALRGLKSVRLSVEVAGTDTAVARIDTLALRVQVEHELQRASIFVSDSGSSQVYVAVHFLTLAGTTAYAFSYRMQLEELASVSRRRAAEPYYVATWLRAGTGLTNELTVTDDVGNAVKSLTDAFLNDHRGANPPRR